MALQLIGAGFGRTGTASVKVALEQIGLGPCYHMSEVMKRPTDTDAWIKAADGQPDWDTLFAGYAAAVDFPSCSFYRELAAHYPSARVLLTHRSPESWFESVHETILSPRMVSTVMTTPFGEMNRKTIWHLFDERLDDRDHMIECYVRHVETVKATIPAERLLVFNVSEGWAPLCEFLERPVPETPFPRVNSRAETVALLELLRPSDGAPTPDQLAEAARRLHADRPGE